MLLPDRFEPILRARECAIFSLESVIAEELLIRWSYNYSLSNKNVEYTTTYYLSGEDYLQSMINEAEPDCEQRLIVA